MKYEILDLLFVLAKQQEFDAPPDRLSSLVSEGESLSEDELEYVSAAAGNIPDFKALLKKHKQFNTD